MIIVKQHFDQGLTFRVLAEKNDVSYHAVRRWCLDYEIYGEKALENNTGKFKNMGIKLTTIKGPKDIEIARLNKQRKKKELELEILKKFDEMMRNLYQKK
ncbi:hypothetical protein [Spiroplasma endosymbiont of Aspidapion aeneum]|uniref:hypothetical protein n=1 Tax=Spiroplasma endosymbiont of Aspidapion aeneum TaxID=3066276 RepID=UPI00313C12E1